MILMRKEGMKCFIFIQIKNDLDPVKLLADCECVLILEIKV